MASNPTLALVDEARPVLQAGVGLLRVLSLPEARGCISDEQLSALMLVTADRLDYALGLVDLWHAHEEM